MNRDHPWSKTTLTRLFVGGVVAVAAGIVLVLAGAWAAIAAGVALTVTLVVVGSVVALVGAGAAVASWFGALLNTARLDDKTWFVGLLVLGLFSCGVLAMIAYVVAGPDGTGSVAPVLVPQEGGLR
jgi:hypothetical protein